MEYQVDDANDRNYNPYNLGTWSSISQVDTFLRRFNHASAYKDGNTKLRVGNYVTIQDGTYNIIWEIAGFDMEHNQGAADGTTYDNGYGICLIPQNSMPSAATWNATDTVAGGYKASTMHNTHLPTIVSKLENVLGNHIVTRNVLLSSSISYNRSNAYTWTTGKATLMSVGQVTGTFAANNNKYDDGEANYRLPIFNSKNYGNGSFWSRGIYGRNSDGNQAWYITGGSSEISLSNGRVFYQSGVRPLIYLR